MAKRLFSSISVKDIIFLGVLIVALAGSAHFWITNPLGFSRLLYPIEAQFATRKLECSEGAPPWLGESLKLASRDQGSLANQVAYIEPNGRQHYCSNGWSKELFGDSAVNKNTRFRFASITKIFTADAILRLINQGKLHLDTRLLELFPEVDSPKDDRVELITIRHLLSHQAGFDRKQSFDTMFMLDSSPWCPGDIGQLGHATLGFSPGESTSYSNLGYCLLGVVIERVTQTPFRQFMSDEYDLSASDVKFVDGPYMSDEVRYDFRNSNFYGENYYRFFDFPAISSSAGLSGSAVMLATYIKEMTEQKPLNLLGGGEPDDCDVNEYRSCYGIAVYRYRAQGHDLDVYIHGGFLPGNATLSLVDERKGVVVWLSSGQPLDGFSVTTEMYDYFYNALVAQYEASDRNGQ